MSSMFSRFGSLPDNGLVLSFLRDPVALPFSDANSFFPTNVYRNFGIGALPKSSFALKKLLWVFALAFLLALAFAIFALRVASCFACSIITRCSSFSSSSSLNLSCRPSSSDCNFNFARSFFRMTQRMVMMMTARTTAMTIQSQEVLFQNSVALKLSKGPGVLGYRNLRSSLFMFWVRLYISFKKAINKFNLNMILIN